jgi:hypothetical protein
MGVAENDVYLDLGHIIEVEAHVKIHYVLYIRLCSWTGVVAQVVECLLCKCKAPNSNLGPIYLYIYSTIMLSLCVFIYFLYFIFIIAVLGAHCDIYKSSYNLS